MKVGLWTEAGPDIGFGHLGRMAALAEALRGAGHSVVLRCTGPAEDDLRRFGFSDRELAGDALAADASWVAVDLRDPLDAAVAERIASETGLCLIDDPGPARSVAQLVVDPPTGAMWPPATGVRLAGCRHAIVRDEFRSVAAAPERGGRVLVTMGGSDPAGLSTPIASALTDVGMEVTVIEGPGFRHRITGGFEVIRDVERMAECFLGRSLTVCGFGNTVVESAVMGVPAVTVAHWEAHLDDAVAFERFGWTRNAGVAGDPHMPGRLAAQVASIVGDAAVWESMHDATSAVDGRGVLRVVEAMATSRSEESDPAAGSGGVLR